MKKGFAIAFSLLRIRRLFFSLILLPLAMSFFVVVIQVFASSTVVQLAEKAEAKRGGTSDEAMNFLRSVTLGQPQPLGEPRICRWVESKEPDGSTIELPPNSECSPDRLDAAVRVSDPANFDVTAVHDILKGSFPRIHVCRTCSPDFILFPEQKTPRLEMHGVWSMLLGTLIARNDTVTEAINNVRATNDRVHTIIGKKYFMAPGYRAPVNLSDMRSTLLLVFNFSLLVIVALWLALKAHRKVLDYFSHNGALLPMVAANGKDNFYGAIWMITLIRVFAFLFSAIPLTILSIHELIFDQTTLEIIGKNWAIAALWAGSLVVSLSLATLIASIADLKHRSHMIMIAYRFLPICAAFFGALLWCATFVLEGSWSPLVRSLICALPVVGMAPLFISLIFQPQTIVLFLNFVLSIALIAYLMRDNARWFAAHLEEI